jgi:hypothetical protein
MNLLKITGTLMLLGSSAWANSIMVGGLDPSLGMQQSLYFDEDGTPSQAYWVGGVDVIVDSTSRLVFCVDLFTDIYLNNTYSTILGLPDTPNLQRVGWLLENRAITSPVVGAAMQLAIWDIVSDNGDGFAPDTGRVTQSTDVNHPTLQGVLDAAVAFETDSLGMSSPRGIVYHNATFDGIPVQNLMGGAVNDGGPQPTAPEPAPVILIGAGLALILAGKRRKSRVPQA